MGIHLQSMGPLQRSRLETSRQFPSLDGLSTVVEVANLLVSKTKKKNLQETFDFAKFGKQKKRTYLCVEFEHF